MPAHSSRDGRLLHNFARGPSPPSTPTINHPKRLVRKYRKSTARFGKNLEKLDKERVPEASETSDKNVFKTSGRYDASDAEITAVPSPIPDTGINPTASKLPGVHHSSISSMAPTEEPTATPVSAFRPLPPLLSLNPTTTSSIAYYTSSIAPSFTSLSEAQEHPQSTQPHHLSAVIITLLAVGFAFLFVGIFVIVKACSRPKRRTHPTPSLPILEDDHFVSPIFGGKERYSPQPGSSGGLYTWTQYSHTGNPIAQPIRAVGYGKALDLHANYDATRETDGKTSITSFNEKTEYPFPGQGYGPAPLANAPYQASFQQVQSAVTRMASRLSTASLSLYPNSPLSDSHVGVAVEGVPPLTADGHPVIKRTKSKTALQKSREANTESAYARYSQGLAYDGADVTSPTQLQSHVLSNIPTAASGGRSRIKSTYYAPGTYPRISAIPVPVSTSTKTNYGGANPFESQHILRKSDSRRERDTHALTSALGLPSPSGNFPMASSPQPTLYPDDSMSVAGDFYGRKPKGNRPTRGHKKPALTRKNTGPVTIPRPKPDQPGATTSADTNTGLGNLMLMEFLPTSKSLAALGAGSPEDTTATLGSSQSLGLVQSDSKKSLRSDDKPPRVPSPPPMPSLTQMGLEHRNPEAYAAYRSPTYSIYGLYESNRKSRVGSIG